MVVEEVIAQYGIAGAALVLMYLMYMANIKEMDKLSTAIEGMTNAFNMLREEIKDMKDEMRWRNN